MKRIILLICLLVLVWCSVSFGAASEVDSVSEKKVWDKGVEWVRTFNSTTSVTAGATTIFKIPMRYVSGKIYEITFASSSTEWVVFLSSVDGLTSPTGDTFIKFSETSQTVGSRSYVGGRTYYNDDTTPALYSYLTIAPITVNSGPWELKIKELMK